MRPQRMRTQSGGTAARGRGGLPSRRHYEVLGVPKDVSESTLKKQYYKVSRAHHPDRNPGDLKAQDKMRQISEACAGGVPRAPRARRRVEPPRTQVRDSLGLEAARGLQPDAQAPRRRAERGLALKPP